ncbi:MAG: hypothetical protein M1827_006452 [Pycnora praestabilis]|nr:MAG: hypothetical protein M1827_006452 [Pycnora praestabilis]
MTIARTAVVILDGVSVAGELLAGCDEAEAEVVVDKLEEAVGVEDDTMIGEDNADGAADIGAPGRTLDCDVAKVVELVVAVASVELREVIVLESIDPETTDTTA